MASDASEEEFDDDWEEWNPSQASFLTHMIAGSFAGVMEHVGMFPVDTYKVSARVPFVHERADHGPRGAPLPRRAP